MKNLLETINQTGISMPKLAEKLGIPYRTLQSWAYNERAPKQEIVEKIYYLAKEIYVPAWQCAVIDFYNETKNSSATLRLLDICQAGLDIINATDINILKAVQPYMSASMSLLINDVIAEKEIVKE